MTETRVFKCGGKFFVPNIVRSFFEQPELNLKDNKTVFVISAMNGITRLLRLIFIIKTEIKIDEELKKLMTSLCLNEFKRSHIEFIFELFLDENRERVINNFESLYTNLEKTINDYTNEDDKDEFYASILQFGELASSAILSSYISNISLENVWFDARDYVVTDENHKEAEILSIKDSFKDLLINNILVTQGFIGRNSKGENTVVGFDGSDYSAAQFANSLVVSGEKIPLTFWKDVDGVYEENPVKNPEAKLIKEMTRKDYIHNTQKNNSFVVRPDSISNLKENVLVTIRSFIDFKNPGTIIRH